MKGNLKLGILGILLGAFTLSGCTKKPVEIPGEQEIEELPVLDTSIEANVPHIYIDIEGDAEVVDKETYLNAEIRIAGNGRFADMDKVKTKIKGRGNSTWSKPKKPYRLKLDKKAVVLGLPAAKDWVLLANYNDYTLMTNAVAMKMGKQLGMPYTNDIIAVDLTVNGEYRGNYNLTQQVEVKENRVDLGEGGVLWEVDKYFDETYKFTSAHAKLPMMLKDPDPESQAQFDQWKAEFQSFEDKLYQQNFPNNNYGELFDKQQFVNFLIVNMLALNNEVNHPKSVFMYKKANGKYTMGPLWDFDYGFGFSEEHGRTYFHFVDMQLIREGDERVGSLFYQHILRDPEIRSLFIKTWNTYRTQKFEELMYFIEVYAAQIRDSQKKDFNVWKIGDNNHALNKAKLKTFLRQRVKVINAYASTL
ncbi:CotH kinase family protein [Sphingobacterium thalpophilum]|uniref:CotH kinase family protein n=1 Tax=Sphingobacterium thalpophilum TaxID=259 RepID=UPI002D793D0F|nr:CotH kinase family protein [Sphingobacterium thalpophilum]